MDPPLRIETIFSPVHSSGHGTQVYKIPSRMCTAPQKRTIHDEVIISEANSNTLILR